MMMEQDTITVVLDQSEVQVVTIEQDLTQTVVMAQNLPPVIELASEGLQGPPGVQGPPGPAGPDLNVDLADLTLIFENKLAAGEPLP